MAAVMSEKPSALIMLLIATTFGSGSVILLHKQQLVHWECSICKNGKERPFLNRNTRQRNRIFKMLCFTNEGHNQAGNLQKDIFLVHLIPSCIERHKFSRPIEF